ncbi:MarR family winged helix-turn-helix transcriptional regulator [Roseomonas sp. CCTCC AB2023176]|uniref:MarR family winged helix-turn-helix transcriptional regulator n=1 Tax=Roseomonas sp. CCTCC AB2023176 TaxID=3342640 RepID=UPI0035DB33AB
MPKPTDAATLAWARLLRAHDAALARVEAALEAGGHPPLAWYDVLLELERGGPQRPRDLQAALLLAQYNLSRLLDRMERRGLIERGDCETDGRGQTIALTEAGTRARRDAWPTYAAAIQDAVGRHLTEEEARTLADLLGRIAGRG